MIRCGNHSHCFIFSTSPKEICSFVSVFVPIISFRCCLHSLTLTLLYSRRIPLFSLFSSPRRRGRWQLAPLSTHWTFSFAFDGINLNVNDAMMEKLSLAPAQKNFTQRYHPRYPLMSEPSTERERKTTKRYNNMELLLSLTPLTAAEHNEITVSLSGFSQWFDQ